MAIYNYTPDSNFYGANETEEERRRREQAASAQTVSAGVAPVAPIPEIGASTEPQPIKQTITYDPVTGEQRMKIEGSVQDLSPANPMTPTVSMPGEPVAAPVEPVREIVQPTDLVPEQQPAQLPQGVQMVNGRLQLAPTTPVEPMTQAQAEMPAQEPAPAMAPLPQPGPAVQVAGPAQMPPAAQPAPVAQQPADPLEAFTSAVGDTNRLLQIYNDKSQDPELRRLAGREASRQLDSETRRADAERRVSTMSPTEIAREMRGTSEEGSWTKRVIFGLLNMQGAMAAEDAKLGIGAKYQSTEIDGRPVMIKVRADGKPMEGFDATTREPLSQRDLVRAAKPAGKLGIVGGTYVNDKTGEVGRVVTDEKTGVSYVQTDTGRKPLTGFRPQASGGTLADQIVAAQSKAGVGLQFAAPTAAAQAGGRVVGETAATYGTPIQQPAQLPVGAAAGVPAPGPVAPGTIPSPDAAAQGRLQQDLVSLNAELSRLPANDSRRPIIEAERSRVQQQLGGAPAPIAAPTVPGPRPTTQTPAQLRQQTELSTAAGKATIETSADLEKKKNEVRIILPAAEQTATNLLNTLNDIVTHPGLDKVVGFPRIISAPLESIPSGDRRNFAQKFKQLGGQEFLAAFNQLKGGGAITEIEGIKAEQAISALKDPGISPAEFKKNMWILRDTIQTGIDNQRQLVGQAPKYAGTPEQQEAKAWLRENPNHPKAAAVRKKLVGY